MALNKKPIQVPFDDKGNQLNYHVVYGRSNVKMVDNFEFDGPLQFYDMDRGRSACTSYFRAPNGMEVTVFMKDMIKFIPRMNGGLINGRFTFVKRGANYGCCFVDDPVED